MLQVPKQRIVNTGHHHLVQSTIGLFIEKAIDAIRTQNPSAKLNMDYPKFRHDNGDQSYNDEIAYVLQNGNVVAGYLATRTPSNFVQYTFFMNETNLRETEQQQPLSIDDFLSEIETEIRTKFPNRPLPFTRRSPHIISYGKDNGDSVDYLMLNEILIAAVIQVGAEPGRNTYVKDLTLYEKSLQE